MTSDATIAARALPLVDLTSLEDEEDDALIRDLCRRARTPAGPVAAVCVYPRWVALCRSELAGSGVRVAAVANFPDGSTDGARAQDEAARAIADGADEVDVVLPWRAWLAGRRDAALVVVAAARAVVPTTLKVILESGSLGDAETVRAAARDALDARADFVKTSTGKHGPGATPEAARAMLTAIREHGGGAGFKASGGVRTTAAAGEYLGIADDVLGPAWAGPHCFRFGASGLLGDLLSHLGPPAPPGAGGAPAVDAGY